MLYFVYTIDGDWEEYFDIKLPEEERFPKEGVLQNAIQREIDLVDKLLKGRFIHFVHTSPMVRDFFLERPFRRLWRDIVKNGGQAGLHCHEDDPYKDYYYHDISRMKNVISERVSIFHKAGLAVECYRGGFLGFSAETVRILEENGILFDFSCEPGRFLAHGNISVCDWRGAPEYHYRMSYDNHCKPGDSKVWEIGVGASKGKYLYFEKSSLEDVEKIALELRERSMEDKCDIIVSVLSHTYEYVSLEEIKNIEEKLSILKKYGSFINLKELKNILS